MMVVVQFLEVIAGGVGHVAEFVDLFLFFANVPVQALGERVEPVGDLVLRAY